MKYDYTVPGHFTVLEFGYEKIVPELVSKEFSEEKGTLDHAELKSLSEKMMCNTDFALKEQAVLKN